MNDPLHDALRDATLAVLLGSTAIPQFATDQYGNTIQAGTITVASAFVGRIQERARKGDFDALIDQAVEKLTADHLTALLSEALVGKMLEGLEPERDRYGGNYHPGWLADKAKAIAVEAATAALSSDEALLDTLRARIGMEVDRNRVGISVQLSDPEKAAI